jgi:hypothetical protein
MEKLNIAVFVDYDNIEIRVKSTLRRDFHVGAVLDALKERRRHRGQVRYANWGPARNQPTAPTGRKTPCKWCKTDSDAARRQKWARISIWRSDALEKGVHAIRTFNCIRHRTSGDSDVIPAV